MGTKGERGGGIENGNEKNWDLEICINTMFYKRPEDD